MIKKKEIIQWPQYIMCPSVVIYAVDHIVVPSPSNNTRKICIWICAWNNYVSYTLVCVYFIVCSMYVSSCSTPSFSSPANSSPANSAIPMLTQTSVDLLRECGLTTDINLGDPHISAETGGAKVRHAWLALPRRLSVRVLRCLLLARSTHTRSVQCHGEICDALLNIDSVVYEYTR